MEDRFNSLRDRGAEIWTIAESHRLAQENRVKSKGKQNLSLAGVTATAGAVAALSGTGFFGALGIEGVLVTAPAGAVAFITASLGPALKLNENAQQAATLSEKIMAFQEGIVDHVSRMRLQDSFSTQDEFLFFDQERQRLGKLVKGNLSGDAKYIATAQANLAATNVHQFQYLGLQQDIGMDDMQDVADDIVAFGVGGA